MTLEMYSLINAVRHHPPLQPSTWNSWSLTHQRKMDEALVDPSTVGCATPPHFPFLCDPLVLSMLKALLESLRQFVSTVYTHKSLSLAALRYKFVEQYYDVLNRDPAMVGTRTPVAHAPVDHAHSCLPACSSETHELLSPAPSILRARGVGALARC